MPAAAARRLSRKRTRPNMSCPAGCPAGCPRNCSSPFAIGLEPMAPRWLTSVAKFGDHLPFYRQAGIFKRQGIDLDRGTLGNWVGRAFLGLTPPHWGDGPPQLHLMPIINHMRAHLRRADRIFVDETRASVLDPGRKATKSGYFWAVVADDRGHGGVGPPIVVRAFLRTDGSYALTPLRPRPRQGASAAIPHRI